MNILTVEEQSKINELKAINKTPIIEYLSICDYWKPNSNNAINCFFKQEKTPSLLIDPKHNKLKCFSCGASYSLIDLIIKDYVLSQEEKESIKSYDDLKPFLNNSKNIALAISKFKEFKENGYISDKQVKEYKQEQIDYTSYINSLIKENANPENQNTMKDYFYSRGITDPSYKLCTLYDSSKQAIIYPYYDWQDSKRLIGYTERYINQNQVEINGCKCKHHGIKKIYAINDSYLTNKIIIVVEGEADLLSVYQALANIDKANDNHKMIGSVSVVAISGTTNYKSIIEALKMANITQDVKLILMLDNDKSGNEAKELLANECKANNIKYSTRNILPTNYDPNDYLLKGREQMEEKLNNTINNIDNYLIDEEATKRMEEEKAIEEYRSQHSLQFFLDSFKTNIKSKNNNSIKTKFRKLDRIIEGMREGLIVVGAMSSVGKTTFVSQIVDQVILSQCRDVLYFSLEMAKEQLVAKSVSRLSYLLSDNEDKHLTINQILQYGNLYNESNLKEKVIDYILDNVYRPMASHTFIDDNFEGVTIEDIKKAIIKHLNYVQYETNINATNEEEEHKRVPLIVIDYLQIIKPLKDNKLSDKQVIDNAITQLKNLCRQYHLTIILISSFNRDSYNTEDKRTSMNNFKESGSIEYTSDILIGLKMENIEDKANEEKVVNLDILKNRNGKSGDQIKYTYNSKYNLFLEEGTSKEALIETLDNNLQSHKEEIENIIADNVKEEALTH